LTSGQSQVTVTQAEVIELDVEPKPLIVKATVVSSFIKVSHAV